MGSVSSHNFFFRCLRALLRTLFFAWPPPTITYHLFERYPRLKGFGARRKGGHLRVRYMENLENRGNRGWKYLHTEKVGHNDLNNCGSTHEL